MKVSKLIEKLISLKEEHGDVDVMVTDPEAGEMDIERVNFIHDRYPNLKNPDGSRIPPYDFIQIE